MSMNSFHARSGRKTARLQAAEKTAPRAGGLQRADTLLVTNGQVPSRARARQLIDAGRVRLDGVVVSKAAQLLPESANLTVEDDGQGRFVSRGALKLDGALSHLGLELAGWLCVDIGQSTGGFTDCLLQRGASRVVGVEVGHDQLHPRLADDARCVTLEGLNARHLTPDQLGEHFPAGGFDLLVCDASFISLTLLMPQWPALLKPEGHIVALVKPQFEVGPQGLGKGGIVRNTECFHELEARIRQAASEAGINVTDWFDSPIAGGDGNHEFLFHGVLTTHLS